MQRPALLLLLVILTAGLVFGSGSHVCAKQHNYPKIDVDLQFGKGAYRYEEAIDVNVKVTNTSGETIWISKGFTSEDYTLEMWLKDLKRNRQLLARRDEPHDEFPDAPPVPSMLPEGQAGKPIRVVPCEPFRPGKENAIISSRPDLRAPYELGLPGEYKAQVQISAMTFKEPVRTFSDHEKRYFCNVDDYEWLGLLTSKERSFRVQPRTTKKASPNFAPVLASTKSNPTAPGNPHQGTDADMTIPDASTHAALDTDIVIDVSKAGKFIIVIMYVQGEEVYNGAHPSPGQAYPNTKKYPDNPNQQDYTLTYNDPAVDFDYCQHVDVQVRSYDVRKPHKMISFNFDFWTARNPSIDSDGDCIPNSVETNPNVGTDPDMLTLFVRPILEDGSQPRKYWGEFIQLFPFPPASDPIYNDYPNLITAGRAFIRPLIKAGIEVVVIGDSGNPYGPMQGETNFEYDPFTDTNSYKPPCDIMEIVYREDHEYCTYGYHNYGHIYFDDLEPSWKWDTKGYVRNQATQHYLDHRYFTPWIYDKPLYHYIWEGTYNAIQINEKPKVPAICDSINPISQQCGSNNELCPTKPIKQCWDFGDLTPTDPDNWSPMNRDRDEAVEFNDYITFSPNYGEITSVGPPWGADYDRKKVLIRTIVHEMGHALLAASEADHCADPNCIMYERTLDWELHDFGPGSCTHSQNEIKDIRKRIHNTLHQ